MNYTDLELQELKEKAAKYDEISKAEKEKKEKEEELKKQREEALKEVRKEAGRKAAITRKKNYPNWVKDGERKSSNYNPWNKYKNKDNDERLKKLSESMTMQRRLYRTHGGKKVYWQVHRPEHPRADKRGKVFEHIVVMEEKLRRPLYHFEVCHHLDGDKLNNHPDNLTIMTNSEHTSYHRKLQEERKRKAKEVI